MTLGSPLVRAGFPSLSDGGLHLRTHGRFAAMIRERLQGGGVVSWSRRALVVPAGEGIGRKSTRSWSAVFVGSAADVGTQIAG
jgi:hypothetical protein